MTTVSRPSAGRAVLRFGRKAAGRLWRTVVLEGLTGSNSPFGIRFAIGE